MEGIRSVLEHCQEDIFRCSCDMPFVSTELMKDILQRRAENKISIAECEGKSISGFRHLSLCGS